MRCKFIGISLLLLLFSPGLRAANPFLDAANEKPVSALFRGTEWSEKIEKEEIPLTARVTTTRLAKATWGAIFKIEFSDLKSKAPEKREMPPLYFLATDERIVLLNEEDNEAAAKRIAALPSAPPFEPGDVYGIAKGEFVNDGRPWESKVEVKGDQCTYLASHNSGHFTKLVWKKGVGLVEHSSGYGAHKEGHRLKRVK